MGVGHCVWHSPSNVTKVHAHMFNKKVWRPFTFVGAHAPSTPTVPRPMSVVSLLKHDINMSVHVQFYTV